MAGPKAHFNHCGAIKSDGKPCKNIAGEGTPHHGVGRCKHHMGCTPSHVQKHGIEMANDLATQYGREEPIEPHDALRYCIRVTYGKVLYAQLRIARLQEEGHDLIDTKVEVLTRPLNMGKDGDDPGVTVEEIRTSNTADLNIWVKVHREALDDLAKYSRMALQSGLEERLVQIEEQQAERVVSMLHATLVELGVNVNDQRVLQTITRNLKLLDGNTIEGSAEDVDE